jgi:hypothetical protein
MLARLKVAESHLDTKRQKLAGRNQALPSSTNEIKEKSLGKIIVILVSSGEVGSQQTCLSAGRMKLVVFGECRCEL